MTARASHYVAADLTSVRWPVDPAVSPDGTRLAYSESWLSTHQDALTYRLSVVDLGSPPDGDTPHYPGAHGARWSPNGSTIAALVEDPGGDRVVGILDSNLQPVWLPNTRGQATHLSWSHDSSSLAVSIQRTDGRFETHIADITGRGISEFGVGPSDHDTLPEASPLDDRIATVAAHDDALVLAVHSTAGAPPLRSSKRLSEVRAIRWSPDAMHLAVLGRPAGAAGWTNQALFIVDAATGATTRVGADIDRSIGQVVRGDDERGIGHPDLAWAADGRSVLVLIADGGSSALYRLDIDGEHERVTDADPCVLQFDHSQRTGATVASTSSPTNPGELRTFSPPLTTGAPIVGTVHQPRPAPTLHATHPLRLASDDGAAVDGWITMPATTPCPLVVQVHGGPHYPVGNRFSFDAQRLAGNGFAVLRLNPHGAQGYGEEFAGSLYGRWGSQDLADILAMVDAATDAYPIDPTRLGIIGESYGGFMTLWALAHSDRFSVGVCENAVSDLRLAAGVNPAFWESELGATPSSNPALYEDLSPITHVDRIEAPLLVIHADADLISPYQQSAALVDAMRSKGRTVDFVTVTGAGHFENVTGKPSTRIPKLETVDTFLRKHLMPADRPAQGAS